ncbi:MAG: F0F1 ATP synthase subunit A [Candidatus Omnitrophota bacterium]
MEKHKYILAEWVNGFLRWAAGIVGIPVRPDQTLLPDHLIMAVFVTLALIGFFRLTVRHLSVDKPGKMQYFLEVLYQFFRSLVDDVIGHEGRRFIPVLATLGLFIAVSNLVGLIPEMESPTANLNTTAGCALFVFCYYHYVGIRKHGALHYLKSFMGPVWWLAWLFFPIELISHFARPLSLSMRLFGNIFGEDLVIVIIASLVPFIAPLPVMALAVFTSLLQAFIFVMLSTIYLAGAVSEEH